VPDDVVVGNDGAEEVGGLDSAEIDEDPGELGGTDEGSVPPDDVQPPSAIRAASSREAVIADRRVT
jgi:hypothetical protein